MLDTVHGGQAMATGWQLDGDVVLVLSYIVVCLWRPGTIHIAHAPRLI